MNPPQWNYQRIFFQTPGTAITAFMFLYMSRSDSQKYQTLDIAMRRYIKAENVNVFTMIPMYRSKNKSHQNKQHTQQTNVLVTKMRFFR